MSKRRVENGTDGRPVRIVDHVFIGDRNAAKARGLLTQHNIKFILNCTPDRDTDPVAGCPCFFEKDASLTYQRVPIFDNRGENLLAHIEPIANALRALHTLQVFRLCGIRLLYVVLRHMQVWWKSRKHG